MIDDLLFLCDQMIRVDIRNIEMSKDEIDIAAEVWEMDYWLKRVKIVIDKFPMRRPFRSKEGLESMCKIIRSKVALGEAEKLIKKLENFYRVVEFTSHREGLEG